MTPFEKACLTGGRRAMSIAKQFGVPVDIVLQFRHQHRVNRERAYKARRTIIERALRIPKEDAPYFRDCLETDRANLDGIALAKWVALPIIYGNHPDSVRGRDGSRYIRDLRKLPLTGFRTGAGVSDIYDERGMDYHAGSMAA